MLNYPPAMLRRRLFQSLQVEHLILTDDVQGGGGVSEALRGVEVDVVHVGLVDRAW